MQHTHLVFRFAQFWSTSFHPILPIFFSSSVCVDVILWFFICYSILFTFIYFSCLDEIESCSGIQMNQKKPRKIFVNFFFSSLMFMQCAFINWSGHRERARNTQKNQKCSECRITKWMIFKIELKRIYSHSLFQCSSTSYIQFLTKFIILIESNNWTRNSLLRNLLCIVSLILLHFDIYFSFCVHLSKWKWMLKRKMSIFLFYSPHSNEVLVALKYVLFEFIYMQFEMNEKKKRKKKRIPKLTRLLCYAIEWDGVVCLLHLIKKLSQQRVEQRNVINIDMHRLLYFFFFFPSLLSKNREINFPVVRNRCAETQREIQEKYKTKSKFSANRSASVIKYHKPFTFFKITANMLNSLQFKINYRSTADTRT